jgi:predicted RNA methylase
MLGSAAKKSIGFLHFSQMRIRTFPFATSRVVSVPPFGSDRAIADRNFIRAITETESFDSARQLSGREN